MGEAVGRQDRLFYEFCLEDIVPDDHLLRRIDAVLDLSWLRAELAPYYSHTGCPSVDPELMIIGNDMFVAHIEGEVVCVSKQPRLDGARALLKRGYPAETLLTTRAHDRGYDSFVVAPIGELAKWTITERDRTGLRRELWRSYQDGVSRSAVEGRTRKSPLRGVRVKADIQMDLNVRFGSEADHTAS